jgi:hypothetical protein
MLGAHTQAGTPAVRALNPGVSAVWPFAWRGADAAGGHIVGIPHSRHVRLQGKLIRLIRKLKGVIFIRGGRASWPQRSKLDP